MTNSASPAKLLSRQDQRKVARLKVAELEGVALALSAAAQALERGETEVFGVPLAQSLRNLAATHTAWIERALTRP